jgi:diacylglycerol kinase (ATP)
MSAPQPDLNRILFVLNPISGDIDKSELEHHITDFCRQRNITSEFFKTTGENDSENLNQKLNADTFDAVFAIGGDGTVNLVARQLINTQTPLGILPLGSGNGLSKDLGIPQKVEEALLLIGNCWIRNIDTVNINGHLSIHLSDLGFNAQVVKRFCEGNTRGPGTYAWIALQEYISYEPKYYKIETDNGNFEGEAFMITIANANAFGSNATINPSGIINDGKFEVCILEPFPKTKALSIMYHLYTDSIEGSFYTHKISCRQANIQNPAHEVTHIDGEFIDLGTEINCRIQPKSLKVILPKP